MSLTSVITADPSIPVEAMWPYPDPYVPVKGPYAPYRSGEISRLNKTWLPWHWSGEQAALVNWDITTARLRDLGRNDPAVIALKRALRDGVIGTGISSAASVMLGIGDQAQLVDDFDDESDESFEEWAELTAEADSRGRLSECDMQRQLFDELVETGEALALRVLDDGPDRQVPLCYEVLESEQLDRWRDRMPSDGVNEIRGGIETDKRHRIVAYYLYDVNPYDWHGSMQFGKSTRVPADRVIHISLPGRPSQTRAVGLHSAIVQYARDLDNYLGSELTSATIASLLSIIHKTATPGAGLGFVGDGMSPAGSDDYGNPTVRLGRGIVCQIPTADSVETVQINRPNSQANVFVNLLWLLMGMGAGVSKYAFTRDYSGTTFIAARAAQIADTASYRPLQRYFARCWNLPVRRQWTSQMAAYGRFSTLSATQFAKQKRRWSRCHPHFPGREQLDPTTETNAAIARIASGLSTVEEETAAFGRKWRRIFRQRAREDSLAKSLGLSLNFERPGTAGKNAMTAANADEEQQQQQQDQEQTNG